VQAPEHAFGIEVSAQQVLDALQNGVTGNDPRNEQDELTPDTQVDGRALAAQSFGETAGLGQVFQDLRLRPVAERRLQPDVQSLLRGLDRGGDEPVHAGAGDLDRAGVQAMPDGPDVAAHAVDVEDLTDLVHDASKSQATSWRTRLGGCRRQ
jgi:hypothetical protein